MKLFSKYNRINLVATVGIFILASLAFYQVLRLILVQQVDEDLRIEEHEIETYVKEHNNLPESVPVKDQMIHYSPAARIITSRGFSTRMIYDSNEAATRRYRVLEFGIQANARLYAVNVAKSLTRTEGMANSILLVSLPTIFLILVATFLINRIVLKRIWKPFYLALDALKHFKIDRRQPIKLPETNIDEFALMNRTLQLATDQAKKDYIALKEFTENASHEMQTPLAILRSKLDLFIQTANMSEEQGRIVQGAYTSVERLARLNQSLLLLAKIENNQFSDTEMVDFKARLEEKVDAFHELWQNQHISLHSALSDAMVRMNPELSDILLNNLLSNASKHNQPGGFIAIELQADQLRIANTGESNELDRKRLFARFYRGTSGKEHTGLGLSIVKQICDVSGLNVEYSFQENVHVFTVSWK